MKAKRTKGELIEDLTVVEILCKLNEEEQGTTIYKTVLHYPDDKHDKARLSFGSIKCIRSGNYKKLVLEQNVFFKKVSYL